MNRKEIEMLYEESKEECIQATNLQTDCYKYAKKKVVERIIKEDPREKEEFDRKTREYLEKGFTIEGAILKASDYIWEKILLKLSPSGVSEWEIGGIYSKIQECIVQSYYPRVCEELVKNNFMD